MSLNKSVNVLSDNSVLLYGCENRSLKVDYICRQLVFPHKCLQSAANACCDDWVNNPVVKHGTRQRWEIGR